MKTWGKRIGFFVLILLALVGLGKLLGGEKGRGKSLGIVEIHGVIWAADDWLKEINDFRKNPNIAGVVVRINSPGGTVGASQEIFDSLQRLAAKKPVVASMGTVAASGGLYAALGAKKIVAEPGTITGSIGVRMEHMNIGDLLRLAKIEYETIKSGALKDLASNTRSLTPEERSFLEDLMKEFHGQFKRAVAVARNLKPEALEKIADGRVLTGAKAVEAGLVDELGGFDKAVEVAAQMAGIKGEPHLVYVKEPILWWVKALMGTAKAYLSGPQICYLYP